MIEWYSSPALRRRCQAGLNKGEAAHKLKRAVFFHERGEIEAIRLSAPDDRPYRSPPAGRDAPDGFMHQRSLISNIETVIEAIAFAICGKAHRGARSRFAISSLPARGTRDMIVFMPLPIEPLSRPVLRGNSTPAPNTKKGHRWTNLSRHTFLQRDPRSRLGDTVEACLPAAIHGRRSASTYRHAV